MTATTSALDLWLDKTFESEDVTGVILVDPKTGLSLGVRGVAKNSDAPYLKWWCQKELNRADAAKVDYRDFTVLVKLSEKLLIGIFKEAETSGAHNYNRVLSYEGT